MSTAWTGQENMSIFWRFIDMFSECVDGVDILSGQWIVASPDGLDRIAKTLYGIKAFFRESSFWIGARLAFVDRSIGETFEYLAVTWKDIVSSHID